mmetsp:Transcript_5240/g.8281  ORF Transcript_5240/g.8281 Transcript_5240/m.8281 type:complete len:169 (-) Transcript_5240:119-625(-)|eukprot:CAMPEP_0178840596 /NCGR_PEP_ID=MMETSP0746-20121128/14498_1 /TAXON_ID=913974 /ORGANISM="Nitzschia punctata, Strain CCMP561" /LENGTH=168 /DNA_ID=CAMNT_0020503755 /DNA_START=86 /DNA_END=592 /DNA_ORIENTATION=+
MADQSQTTTNTPSEPVLCKLGCGFFGNNATGGYCSKCWRDVQKTKEESAVPAPKTSTTNTAPTTTVDDVSSHKTDTEQSVDRVVEEEKAVTVTLDTPDTETGSATTAAALATENTTTTIKKKKAKKKSYKNMMASMMHSSPSRDTDKEKDAAIRKVTGGGAFSKIDKI